MAEIDDWLDLMTQTVTIQPFVSRDKFGAPSYGSPTTYAARVNFKDHFIRNPLGEQVVSRGTIWVAAQVQFNVNDLVTLPDGTTPKIADSNLEYSEIGALYCRLDLA